MHSDQKRVSITAVVFTTILADLLLWIITADYHQMSALLNFSTEIRIYESVITVTLPKKTLRTQMQYLIASEIHQRKDST